MDRTMIHRRVLEIQFKKISTQRLTQNKIREPALEDIKKRGDH
jgi:hypothetical protein